MGSSSGEWCRKSNLTGIPTTVNSTDDVPNPQNATTRWVGDINYNGDIDDGDNDDSDDSDNDVGAPIIQVHITAAHHVCPLRSGHGGSAR